MRKKPYGFWGLVNILLNSRKVLGLIWWLYLWCFWNGHSEVFFQCVNWAASCIQGTPRPSFLCSYAFIGSSSTRGLWYLSLEPLAVEMIGRSHWPWRSPLCSPWEEEGKNYRAGFEFQPGSIQSFEVALALLLPSTAQEYNVERMSPDLECQIEDCMERQAKLLSMWLHILKGCKATGQCSPKIINVFRAFDPVIIIQGIYVVTICLQKENNKSRDDCQGSNC